MKRVLRLTSTKDFDLVKTEGKRIFSSNFVVYFKSSLKPKVGIVVSKKVAKRAVDRNLIKRQLRTIITLNKSILQNFQYVVIVKNSYSTNSFIENGNSLVKIIKKAGEN